MPALVGHRGCCKVQGLPLDHTAPVGVKAVVEPAAQAGLDPAFQAGEGAATVVQGVGADIQVAGLADGPSAEVGEGAADNLQIATGLHAAQAVVDAGGLDAHTGIAAVDETVVVVLHRASRRQQQGSIGRDGAASAVVQVTGEQGQQALADDLAVPVVDLGGPLQQ
ncbi:hypothetical protein D9M69_342890 [compost metagenome]